MQFLIRFGTLCLCIVRMRYRSTRTQKIQLSCNTGKRDLLLAAAESSKCAQNCNQQNQNDANPKFALFATLSVPAFGNWARGGGVPCPYSERCT